MDKDKKNPKENHEEPSSDDVDLGFMKFNLGGIFKGLGNLVDLASKLAEEGKEFKKEGEFTSASKDGKGVKGVYGFSIRTMAGGKPFVETFGNVKKTPKGPVVDEVREPLVDVFDEGSEFLIVSELPGVNEADINLEIRGDILILKAEGKDRKYRKEILLPGAAIPETLKYSYKNGILEIRVQKKS